jgi:hypothetical protein
MDHSAFNRGRRNALTPASVLLLARCLLAVDAQAVTDPVDTAALVTAPHGSAVKFAITPAAGKTIRSAWWSFDAPAHLATGNSRATNPTFYHSAAGTCSPFVEITYTDDSTETIQRMTYVRAT